MSDDFRKLIRLVSLLLKQTAFVVEDAREIQMAKRELLKQNVSVIDYNFNKDLYDIALLLKELSRKKQYKTFKDLLDVIEMSVKTWESAYNRRYRK